MHAILAVSNGIQFTLKIYKQHSIIYINDGQTCVLGKSKKDNGLPLKLLLVQFTATQNCGMLILIIPGSQTNCAHRICTLTQIPACSLLEDSFVLRPAGAYKVDGLRYRIYATL